VDPAGTAEGIPVTGPRLVLRPLRPEEIDEQWQAMATADPMSSPEVPDEARFRARLRRSGQLVDGWIDLAIDLDGAAIGRIQTFVPGDRPLPAGTFEVGIGLRESQRGKGYGREAVALLTSWLFEHAGAQAVQAPTDPANVAMATVFDRIGWALAGTVTGYGRRWAMYRITRPEWEARSPAG
jgi:RimJ/RimL family protein N-acetyltransferase